MPGYPFVEGASSKHPERILSWFLDRYPEAQQRAYLTQYAKDGYTHLLLSLDDSLAPTDCAIPNVRPGGAGQTLEQFIATCQRVRQYVPYVKVMLGSKYYSPANMTLAQYQARFGPALDALLAAKCVDEVTPAWEMDLWNVPGPTTIAIAQWVGQRCHAAGVSCWLHFSPEYTSWYADGDPRGRFGFWQDLGTDVDGLDYQGRVEWSLAERQARAVDTLWQFGTEGNRHKFRYFEADADAQFDGDHPTEDESDLNGYVVCCTVDNVRHTDARVWGSGNGLRAVDGSAL